MTATRITALVLGGALMTSWLVVAATDRQPAPPPPRAPAVATPAVPAPLAAETARLRAFLEHAPAPRTAGRNPFTFAGSKRADDRRVAAAAVADATAAGPAAPVPPEIRLIAIVSDGAARSAALSVGGEVVVARAGDVVGGRYRVAAVGADVVELTDQLGGPTLRLGLR